MRIQKRAGKSKITEAALSEIHTSETCSQQQASLYACERGLISILKHRMLKERSLLVVTYKGTARALTGAALLYMPHQNMLKESIICVSLFFVIWKESRASKPGNR